MSGSGGRVRVSVCAVKDLHDVRAVVDGGADALGVLVLAGHHADDAVSLEEGRTLLEQVPPYVGRYAITHAVDLVALESIIATLPIDTLQLHDNVALEVVETLHHRHRELRLIKSLLVGAGVAPDPRKWTGLVDAVLFDSVRRGSDQIGGTGLVHDWSASATAGARAGMPVILAGGLTPANVGAAVAQVQPWGVNVNSGVEADGAKDRDLVAGMVAGANQSV